MYTENLLRIAVSRGLTAADFELMDMGGIIDFLIVCQNEDFEAEKRKKKGSIRYATAEDIAAF